MKLFYFLLFILLLISCDSGQEIVRKNVHITCGAEKVKGDKLIAGDSLLLGASTRIEKYSHTGKFGVKVDSLQPYSFGFELDNVQKGDVVHAEVWRLIEGGEGKIVISADDELYLDNSTFEFEENNWGRISISVVLEKAYKRLKVYVYNPSGREAFFDDISIHLYFDTKKPEPASDDLKIELSKEGMDSLLNFRKLAIEKQIITDESKGYVSGFIEDDGERKPISLRLKGDWTDHLASDKWSLRIKVEGDYAYKGLKTFSIQSPTTRGYMREWLAHQIFEQEDVLTTSYTFTNVRINGEQMGVYALEEHFDKQLLEKRNRREGPIVKFDESGIWQQFLLQKKSGELTEGPVLEASEIIPFKANRTFKDPNLYQQFLIAKSHMQRYRGHDEKVSAYMDVERIAKYLALTDVLNGKHGNRWHNQRFYFNPITLKLEVIAYDCFTNPEESNLPDVSLLGLQTQGAKAFNLTEFLVSNDEVAPRYLHYLKKYSSPSFWTELTKKLQKEIAHVEELLVNEYPFAVFEKELFNYQVDKVRMLLPEYEKYVPVRQMEQGDFKFTFKEFKHGVLFEDISLKVYPINRDTEEQSSFLLQNFHTSDIIVIGYSTKGSKKIMVSLQENIILDKYISSPQEITVKFPSDLKRVYFTARNCGGKIFEVKVSKFPSVGVIQNISESADISHLPFIKDGTRLILKRGDYELNKDVIIPAGKNVILEAGVNINMTKSACFISYSPVFAFGNKSHPIRINSSDSTANGFTIITEGERSTLHYLWVDGLRSLNKKMASLTGAVTIYGGKVDMLGCSFKNNNSEDGLNLIRCHFLMRHCEVMNAPSDGFDADFCSGVLKDSKFNNTGNDCIDFSGSEIKIESCLIKDAGDKGISGGEKSRLTIRKCIIDGANIAVASKDLSNLTIYDLDIKKTNIAFAAYRKKPEYGPAEITVHSIKSVKSNKLYLLEIGSKLKYLDDLWQGDQKVNIDSLYMVFNK